MRAPPSASRPHWRTASSTRSAIACTGRPPMPERTAMSSPRPISGDMLPSAADHAGRYAAAIEAELREAMTAGAKSVGGSAKLDASAAKRVKAALADGIVDPLRDRLHRATAQAGADGNELASL